MFRAVSIYGWKGPYDSPMPAAPHPEPRPASSGPTHPAAEPIDELLKACESQRYRASGPGGQHRNKVETAIRLTHRPTGISASATERRSQEANRQQSLFRLRVNLALEVRYPVPTAAAPSATWAARTKAGRLAINPSHDDFPALLAEALDRLAHHGWDHAAAAAALDISASQLLKLLRHDARALELLNTRRATHGCKPLR